MSTTVLSENVAEILVQPKLSEVATRSFHETVVEAIMRASEEELVCLGVLIKATRIQENHDRIIMAWNERRSEMGWDREDLGVPADLLAQKTMIKREKARQTVSDADIEELRRGSEELVALLLYPDPDFPNWMVLLREKIEYLSQIIQ